MHEISIFDKSLAGQAWLDMPEPVHERMRAESIALRERARRWAAFGRVADQYCRHCRRHWAHAGFDHGCLGPAMAMADPPEAMSSVTCYQRLSADDAQRRK